MAALAEPLGLERGRSSAGAGGHRVPLEDACSKAGELRLGWGEEGRKVWSPSSLLPPRQIWVEQPASPLPRAARLPRGSGDVWVEGSREPRAAAGGRWMGKLGAVSLLPAERWRLGPSWAWLLEKVCHARGEEQAGQQQSPLPGPAASRNVPAKDDP